MEFGQCFLQERQSGWLTVTGNILADCAIIETRNALMPSCLGNCDRAHYQDTHRLLVEVSCGFC
jgi:hypothetical protein